MIIPGDVFCRSWAARTYSYWQATRHGTATTLLEMQETRPRIDQEARKKEKKSWSESWSGFYSLQHWTLSTRDTLGRWTDITRWRGARDKNKPAQKKDKKKKKPTPTGQTESILQAFSPFFFSFFSLVCWQLLHDMQPGDAHHSRRGQGRLIAALSQAGLKRRHIQKNKSPVLRVGRDC